jgi:hypothetical protein
MAVPWSTIFSPADPNITVPSSIMALTAEISSSTRAETGTDESETSTRAETGTTESGTIGTEEYKGAPRAATSSGIPTDSGIPDLFATSSSDEDEDEVEDEEEDPEESEDIEDEESNDVLECTDRADPIDPPDGDITTQRVSIKPKRTTGCNFTISFAQYFEALKNSHKFSLVVAVT